MNNLNSIILEGNLTRDPESSLIPNGTQVCNMQLASNRYYKRGDEQCKEVLFIRMESWGSTANICERYLHKGSWIRAVGRLKQERWESAEGASRERFVIVAEHIEFRSSSKKNLKPETELAGDAVEEAPSLVVSDS